jgi:DNA polymerase III epsilon subunit-like protein
MNKHGFKWESVFHYRKKDTIQMMDDWRLFTDEDYSDYRLSSCCSVFGIEIPNSHDATADAFATMQLAHAITADIRNRIKGIKGIV